MASEVVSVDSTGLFCTCESGGDVSREQLLDLFVSIFEIMQIYLQPTSAQNQGCFLLPSCFLWEMLLMFLLVCGGSIT